MKVFSFMKVGGGLSVETEVVMLLSDALVKARRIRNEALRGFLAISEQAKSAQAGAQVAKALNDLVVSAESVAQLKARISAIATE